MHLASGCSNNIKNYLKHTKSEVNNTGTVQSADPGAVPGAEHHPAATRMGRIGTVTRII